MPYYLNTGNDIDITADVLSEMFDTFTDPDAPPKLVVTYSVPALGIENEKVECKVMSGSGSSFTWENEDDSQICVAVYTDTMKMRIDLPFEENDDYNAVVSVVAKEGGVSA